jgi:hypothetical protein
MSSGKTKLGLAFAATATVFAALTLIFWEFMRDTIVMPLYYLIWVSDLILKSIPQGAYLGILVLIGLVIGSGALQSIQSRQMTHNHQRTRSMDSARYLFWQSLHNRLITSEFSRNHFAWEARKLILSILAYQEGIDVSQVEAMVIDGTLSVPNTVRYLIQRREIRASSQTPPAIHNLTFRLRRLLFKLESPTDPQIAHQVEEIVAFIEHRLEITHAANPPES